MDGIFSSLDDVQRAQLAQLLMLVCDDLTGGDEHCATQSSLDRNIQWFNE